MVLEMEPINKDDFTVNNIVGGTRALVDRIKIDLFKIYIRELTLMSRNL